MSRQRTISSEDKDDSCQLLENLQSGPGKSHDGEPGATARGVIPEL